jgi:hypothetical protein
MPFWCRAGSTVIAGPAMHDRLTPPYASTLIVTLDLVHNAARRSGHRSGPGSYYGSDGSANHRTRRGADRRAGGLLSGSARAGQKTQNCNESGFLHEFPPHGLSYDHQDNSAKTGQFSGQTSGDAINRESLEV